MTNPQHASDDARPAAPRESAIRRIVAAVGAAGWTGIVIGGYLLVALVLVSLIQDTTSPGFKLDEFLLDDLWMRIRANAAQYAGVGIFAIVLCALTSGCRAAFADSTGNRKASANGPTNPWGTPYDEDAQRQRRREAARVAFWRRRAYRRHLWGVVLVALFGVLFGVLFLVQGAIVTVREPYGLRDTAGGIVLCAAGLLIVGGVVLLAAASFRSRPVDEAPDSKGVFRPVASQRPFDKRLGQYLDERPTPALGADSATRRPMALFIAWLPGSRRPPKSPGYLREILERIQRLLRGA
jgi:hypothetical protein